MGMKITIPTELKDIKLSQFQKFLKTTKDIEDVDFVNRQLVGIFCNISDDAVKSILAKDFDDIVTTITATLNKSCDLVTTFKLHGVEYGFIPDIEDITVGEKADIDANINDWQKFDKVIKVCYRTINYKHKGTYLIDDYTGKEESIDVTLDVAIGCMLFFYNLMSELVNYIPNFLEAEAVQNPKLLQILAKNGHGIKTFTHSLREIFSNLMPLQK